MKSNEVGNMENYLFMFETQAKVGAWRIVEDDDNNSKR